MDDFFDLLAFITVIACLLLLSSCASLVTEQVLDPKVYYRHDMKIEVNGEDARGIYVAPKADKYEIEITAPGKIDLLKVTSCHRQFSTEDVPDGWFRSGKYFKFNFEPMPGIEDVGSCMLKFEAYEAGVEGRHSSGLLEWQTPDEKLPALLRCNGEERGVKGVAICQSWEDLIQEIRFPVPVNIGTPLERCEIPIPDDRMNWEFQIPNRECTYNFQEVGEEGRFFRLQTIGYEQIAIRGE